MFLEDISQTPAFGKSVRVYEVYPDTIDHLYQHGNVPIPSNSPVYPNQPLILKAGQQKSALAIVNREGDALLPASDNISYFNIRGRNKEQVLLQNIFQNPDIRVIIVTGAAGTGKTTLIGGHVLHQIMEVNAFKRLLLSKPLEIVTASRYWGTVPGDEHDKFGPFLKSYQIMFEGLCGDKGDAYVQTAMTNGVIQFFPLELMRGASLKNCIMWYDEAQNLNHHEMNTLGSRMDDTGKSKLILSGDLYQQDRSGVEGDKAGLSKLAQSNHFLNSPHTAHVHLIKNERGVISQLFFDVFDKDRRQ